MFHERIVHNRRTDILSRRIAALIPPNASVLDIGCGDGQIASLIQHLRTDVTIDGVDVLVRGKCFIPVKEFDGRRLPCGDKTYDVALFVDVLHHTDDPRSLLAEAVRASRKAIIIKDHLRKGFLANATLRLMDRVGNCRFGVRLPYNYWQPEQWHACFKELGLTEDIWDEKLHLYPLPLTLLFDRSLHFIAYLAC